MNGADVVALVALGLAALGWSLFLREVHGAGPYLTSSKQAMREEIEYLGEALDRCRQAHDWHWNLSPELQSERESLFADIATRRALRASLTDYYKENR